MLRFLDRAFCSSDCVNSACSRHFGPAQEAAAKAWADRSGFTLTAPPVSFQDFSEVCKDYRSAADVTSISDNPALSDLQVSLPALQGAAELNLPDVQDAQDHESGRLRVERYRG